MEYKHAAILAILFRLYCSRQKWTKFLEREKVGKAPSSDIPMEDGSAMESEVDLKVTKAVDPVLTVRILYASVSGTSKACASWLEDAFQRLLVAEGGKYEVDVVDLSTYDQDNLEQEDIVVFAVSTWTNGLPPPPCKVFFDWLADMTNDFRVDKSRFLARTRFAVIGLGLKDYGKEEFCLAGRRLHDMMISLGATGLLRSQCFDTATDIKSGVQSAAAKIADLISNPSKVEPASVKNDSATGIDPAEDPIDTYDEEVDENLIEDELGDLEDLVVEDQYDSDGLKEMLTPIHRKTLTKQGYKIIGSHSAVKLCRWTKNNLRGRGACYKNGFYGIQSYNCCEATPSLACASKCVFCWRHSTNPVGTSFKWKSDEPAYIVEEAIKEHRKMIKSLRGVPGVLMDRYEDAFTVRHCALSLVGEPIMYPRINELVDELHARDISTFLVTNAVFPDAMKSLIPVTQLYVSVDAATKDALKAVDRPLHKDFWERFMTCLALLKKKKQRTVFRLTLVKEWNMQEVDEYVKLLDIGEPDLVEIKGVTFCGKSDASNLTMANVPFHEDVRRFALAISEKSGGRYGPACEHAHSCCTLLARTDKFFKDGKWNTWIDFKKFQELYQNYLSTGQEFTTEDYMAPTPEWAVWDAEAAGFNPAEQRFQRTKKAKAPSIRPPAGLPNGKLIKIKN